jgi:SAM-dependent methyltransferase
VLGEWARILRPSGILVASVPDTRHPLRRLEKAAARLLVRPDVPDAPDASPASRAPTDWLARLSPRAARYVAYLRLSKNRYAHDAWLAKAERHGFVPFVPAAVMAEPPLELLCFERR